MSTIKSSDEHLTLNADGTSKDIKFQANGVEKASISSAGVISSDGGSTHADNVKAKFGTSNDLEIYHDGSNSRIKDVGTGVLAISGNELNFNNADNTTNLLIIKDDGRVVSQSNAHAWLTMNGTGTISISDSYNVSSIADNGTGFYDMNFDVDMANANYAAVGSAGLYAGSVSPYAKYTATYAFKVLDNNGNAGDDANIMLVAFGDSA